MRVPSRRLRILPTSHFSDVDASTLQLAKICTSHPLRRREDLLSRSTTCGALLTFTYTRLKPSSSPNNLLPTCSHHISSLRTVICIARSTPNDCASKGKPKLSIHHNSAPPLGPLHDLRTLPQRPSRSRHRPFRLIPTPLVLKMPAPRRAMQKVI